MGPWNSIEKWSTCTAAQRARLSLLQKKKRKNNNLFNYFRAVRVSNKFTVIFLGFFFTEKSGKNEGKGVKLQVVSGLPVRVMLS